MQGTFHLQLAVIVGDLCNPLNGPKLFQCFDCGVVKIDIVFGRSYMLDQDLNPSPADQIHPVDIGPPRQIIGNDFSPACFKASQGALNDIAFNRPAADRPGGATIGEDNHPRAGMAGSGTAVGDDRCYGQRLAPAEGLTDFLK
ncbi:MAG: hypothetical protein QNI97_09675 [Desulfobacterales bacterium]|nr:hypothetical protein [Desulfobacterales bacterium]